jgi:hypothetical protein
MRKAKHRGIQLGYDNQETPAECIKSGLVGVLGKGRKYTENGGSGHQGVLIKHRGRKGKGKKGEWARSERSEIQGQIAIQKVEDGQCKVLSKNDDKCRRRALAQ